MFALRDRAKAFEDKFAHEEGLKFRAECLRHKLVGLWAASVLGVKDADHYADDLVTSAVKGASLSQIATKLRHDFGTAGVAFDEQQVASRMDDCMQKAWHELEAA